MVDTIKIDELLTIDWITIHFGKNPKNGGKPPSERRDENRRNFITLLLLFIRNVWLIKEICKGLTIQIIDKVNPE